MLTLKASSLLGLPPPSLSQQQSCGLNLLPRPLPAPCMHPFPSALAVSCAAGKGKLRKGQGGAMSQSPPRKGEDSSGKASPQPRLKETGVSRDQGQKGFSLESRSLSGPARSDSLVLDLSEWAGLQLPENPPQSEDEALQQAGACLRTALVDATLAAEPMTLRKRQTGRVLSRTRLQLEVPLMDVGPEAQVSLLLKLLSLAVPSPASKASHQEPFPGGSRAGVEAGLVNRPLQVCCFLSSTVLADRAAEVLGSEGQTREDTASGWTPCGCFSLPSVQAVPKEAQVVLVVCPSPELGPKILAAVASAGPRPVVLLNPGWAPLSASPSATTVPEGRDGEHFPSHPLLSSSIKQLDDEFSVAYAFVPLAIQGLLGSTAGALLSVPSAAADKGKTGRGVGGRAAPLWVLFKQQGAGHKRLAVLRRKPDADELQTLFYADMASESPVARSIQFVKAMFGKG